MKKLITAFITTMSFLPFAFSVEVLDAPSLKELAIETTSEIKLGNKIWNYRAIAGKLILKDDKGSAKATVSYTAYFAKDVNTPKRPLTFCFNGGPGAGSAWLNLGLCGPKCFSTDGISYLNPPYGLEDNPDSFLDTTDLVFIDPAPAGVSEIQQGHDPQSFYTVEEDVKMMCDIVTRLTSIYQRWDSPKYLMGESYGGMRVVKMGNKMHDDGLYINGLILISPALDLQNILIEKGNELPYMLFLPSYAAAAWYHKKSDEDLDAVLEKAEKYALREYAIALLQGNRLEKATFHSESLRLAEITTLSFPWIEQVSLRIKPRRFMRELLKDKGRILGTYDSRYTGMEDAGNELHSGYDPSFEAVFGAVTAVYSQYLLKELKWPEPVAYKALVLLQQWNWGKANKYASAVEDLKELMIHDPDLKIFIGTGIYDLAVPYFASDYTVNHLDVARSALNRIKTCRYPAGHMMYFDRAIRKKLKEDIAHMYIP